MIATIAAMSIAICVLSILLAMRDQKISDLETKNFGLKVDLSTHKLHRAEAEAERDRLMEACIAIEDVLSKYRPEERE